MLFFHYMAIDTEHIRVAALFTFGNVILVSLLLMVIYSLIGYFTVKRPLRKIVAGLENMTRGDFSVRLDDHGINPDFNEIAESINLMAAELSSVETLKTDFVSNVSHEIKTPIAVIGNYSRLLQEAHLTDQDRISYATSIHDASVRLSELVTNILRLNKLENQRLQPKNQSYDLAAQLGECILQFENIWDEKGIDLEVHMPDEEMICADKELLFLVWSNLLSNAFKFTDSGGKVSVTMITDENDLQVEVADTGCGMSAETGRHIFDKFYQADTSHAVQGNGLGLALVKRIIDIVEGDITVTSTEGRGSAFMVKLRRYPHE